MNYIKWLTKLSRYARRHPNVHQVLHRASAIKARLEGVIPDRMFAKRMYRRYTGMRLELDQPKLYNEKLWWLKLHYRNPLTTQCTDKYLVRDYVKECGFESILTELIGVYDDARDVPIERFDHEVFIKCNHGSGTNLIYKPNTAFDRKRFDMDFSFDLRQNHFWNSREWNYRNIQPRIMCEQVLRDSAGNLPRDYKFMCFGGVPQLLFLESEVGDEQGRRNTSGTRFVNVYDMDFRLTPITSGCPSRTDMQIQRPSSFETMKKIAAKLSGPFPHCRVDLYDVDGKVYFGELTFFHGGGCVNIRPLEWQEQMGSWIDLESIPRQYLKN